MLKYLPFIIILSGLAGGITTATLDQLRIPHDPSQLDDDYLTTLLDCDLRAGPGPFFAVIDSIPSGTRLPIIFWMETHQDGTWIRTEFNGKKGWIEDRLYKNEPLVKYTSNDEPFTTSSLEDRRIITQCDLFLHEHSWENSKVLATIPAGTLLRCCYFAMTNLNSFGDFEIEVMYNNVKGWIRLKDSNTPMQAKSENSDREYITTLYEHKLYEKPGESARVLDAVPGDTKLPLLFWSEYGSPGPWIQTEYQGKLGWICGEKHYRWVISTNDGISLDNRKSKNLGFGGDVSWGYPATRMTGSNTNKVWRSGPDISYAPLNMDVLVGDIDLDGYIVFADGDWALVQTFILMGWVPIDIDGKPNMLIYSDLSPLYEGPPLANPNEAADSNWDFVDFTLHGDGYPPGNRLYVELSVYFMFKGKIKTLKLNPVAVYQPPESSKPIYRGNVKYNHSTGIYETVHFYYPLEMPPQFKPDEPFRLDATVRCKGLQDVEITYPPLSNQ